jgi:hypothetical protein
MLETTTIEVAAELCLDCVHTSTQEVVTHPDAVFHSHFDEADRVLWLRAGEREGLTPVDVLASALSQLLVPGPPLALGPLLLASDEAKEGVALQQGLIHRGMENRGGRGLPGQPVTGDDLAALQPANGHIFYCGEIVAARAASDEEQSQWIYAQVRDVEEGQEDTFGVEWLMLRVSSLEGAAVTRTAAVEVRVFYADARRGATRLDADGGGASASRAADLPGVEENLTPAQKDIMQTIQNLLEQAKLPATTDTAKHIDRALGLSCELREVREYVV